jgi:hypothetical protein
VDLSAPEGEEFFRRQVLSDVRSDPTWYALILARRVTATVWQTKLWPWSPVDGMAYTPSSSASEGRIDQYYRFTRTVDFVGLGSRQFELPVWLLVAPTLILLGRGAYSWMRGGPDCRMRLRSHLTLLGCPALALLGAPVLVTTASGLETQAFALVYFLGLGLCLEELRTAMASR